MIKTIAFDLDDTLFNATWLIDKSRMGGLKRMEEKGLIFEDIDKAFEELQKVTKEFGSNHSNHYDILLKRLKNRPDIVKNPDFSISKFVACGIWGYHAVKVRFLKPYKDVKRSLEKLKGQNLKLAIFSDGLAIKQYEKLLRMDIVHFMDYIFISEEINLNKPNTEFYNYCLREMDVEPNEVIYIGDRIDKDISPSKMIGMHSVLIHRGGKYDPNVKENKIERIVEPDYEIHSLSELPKILNRITKAEIRKEKENKI